MVTSSGVYRWAPVALSQRPAILNQSIYSPQGSDCGSQRNVSEIRSPGSISA